MNDTAKNKTAKMGNVHVAASHQHNCRPKFLSSYCASNSALATSNPTCEAAKLVAKINALRDISVFPNLPHLFAAPIPRPFLDKGSHAFFLVFAAE